MFDFMVFGYYAFSIGHTFFPNENAFASLSIQQILRPLASNWAVVISQKNRRPTISRMVGLRRIDCARLEREPNAGTNEAEIVSRLVYNFVTAVGKYSDVTGE